MANSNFNEENAQQVSDKAKSGIDLATRKARNKAGSAIRKIGKKTAKKAVKVGIKVGQKMIMGFAKLLLNPYSLAAIGVIIFLVLISTWFMDFNFESKSKLGNYQNESLNQDNEYELDSTTGRYSLSSRSNGNIAFKMYYAYMAQRGVWKVVVDEDGKATTDLIRGDKKEAEDIVDKYKREKDFSLSSDLLYLLDTTTNVKYFNDFYFPEQFIQPVPYDDETFELKQLTNDNGVLTALSTKYDENGKPTSEKEIGVWDYGFGSILQYQKFEEDREKRASATNSYSWDFDTHQLVSGPANESDQITEKVDGYPQDIYMIVGITNALGNIKNEVKQEWVQTGETFTKEVDKTINGEVKETYTVEETVTDADGNTTTKTVTKSKWVSTDIPVTIKYSGYVWEYIPQYDGEPNTDGIIGDKYMFDYLTNFETYVPDVAMEDFDIEERTSRDIDGLTEIFQKQESVENAESEYDAAETGEVATVGGVANASLGQGYAQAMRYFDIFEIMGKRYGVDPYLLVAKAVQESGGEHEKNCDNSAGYGLMQIEDPGSNTTSAKAFNLETGQMETMTISSRADVKSVEDNIRAGTMMFASKVQAMNYNIPLAIQGYNYGSGGIGAVIELYANSKGITTTDVKNNIADLGWTAYRLEVHNNPSKYFKWSSGTFGDEEYLEHVLQYYNYEQGTPYVIDQTGTKHSMDGSVTGGAAIVGNGTSSNKNWFASFVDKLTDTYDQMFDDSPSDALENKDDYVWRKFTSRLNEDEYSTFIRMYWSYANDLYLSEVKDKITVDDWKEKYKLLFENTSVAGTIDQNTLTEYDAFATYFPDGYGLPIEKFTKISKDYDGTVIKLTVKKGETIKAMSKGKVSYVDSTLGIIEITHSTGVKTRYTGVKDISVKVDDEVDTGATIGNAQSSELGLSIIDSQGNSINPTPIFIVMGDGSQIYNYQGVLNAIMKVDGYPYKMTGDANNPLVTGYADCSGLMQYAFKTVGINLPRTANAQYNAVTHISASEARPGDLVFFQGTYNASVPITHVGLYIGNGQMWNAQGKGVMIANISPYWSKYSPVYGRITKK